MFMYFFLIIVLVFYSHYFTSSSVAASYMLRGNGVVSVETNDRPQVAGILSRVRPEMKLVRTGLELTETKLVRDSKAIALGERAKPLRHGSPRSCYPVDALQGAA